MGINITGTKIVSLGDVWAKIINWPAENRLAFCIFSSMAILIAWSIFSVNVSDKNETRTGEAVQQNLKSEIKVFTTKKLKFSVITPMFISMKSGDVLQIAAPENSGFYMKEGEIVGAVAPFSDTVFLTMTTPSGEIFRLGGESSIYQALESGDYKFGVMSKNESIIAWSGKNLQAADHDGWKLGEIFFKYEINTKMDRTATNFVSVAKLKKESSKSVISESQEKKLESSGVDIIEFVKDPFGGTSIEREETRKEKKESNRKLEEAAFKKREEFGDFLDYLFRNQH